MHRDSKMVDEPRPELVYALRVIVNRGSLEFKLNIRSLGCIFYMFDVLDKTEQVTLWKCYYLVCLSCHKAANRL